MQQHPSELETGGRPHLWIRRKSSQKLYSIRILIAWLALLHLSKFGPYLKKIVRAIPSNFFTFYGQSIPLSIPLLRKSSCNLHFETDKKKTMKKYKVTSYAGLTQN